MKKSKLFVLGLLLSVMILTACSPESDKAAPITEPLSLRSSAEAPKETEEHVVEMAAAMLAAAQVCGLSTQQDVGASKASLERDALLHGLDRVRIEKAQRSGEAKFRQAFAAVNYDQQKHSCELLRQRARMSPESQVDALLQAFRRGMLGS